MGSPQQLSERAGRGLRLVGFVAGLCLVAAILLVSRPAAGSRSVGADVTLSVMPTGELGVVPAGDLLVGRHLKPGAQIAGSFLLRNQTGATVAVAMRAERGSGDLDAMLLVRITAGARTWFDGALSRLRSNRSAPVKVAPGEEARVGVRVSLQPGVDGYRGRATNVALLLLSRPTDQGR